MSSWLDSWTKRRVLPGWKAANHSRKIREPGFRSARDMLDEKPRSVSALARPAEPNYADHDWPWLAALTGYSRHMARDCKEFFPWPRRNV